VPSTPQQLRIRARFESALSLATPFLDLMLLAGERVSRIAAPDDDYVPVRPASDRIELGPKRRPDGDRRA
jgi:hypothetical protein